MSLFYQSGFGVGSLQVVSKTTTYVASSADQVILAATGSGWTLTLPSAGTNPGQLLRIKKTSNDFNVLTISRAGSDTIQDATASLTSTSLNTQGEEITLVADGTNLVWQILNRRIPGAFTLYTSVLGAGYGTATQDIYWKRVLDSIVIKGDITCGTVSGAAGTIGFPSGPTIDPTKLANITSVGTFAVSTASTAMGIVLADGKVADSNTQALTIGAQLNASAGLVSRNVSAVLNNGDRFTFITAPIPITGWNG